MGAEAKTDRLEGTLLALLEYEERLAHWESLPATAREEAVEQLARMMLQVAEGESGDETGSVSSASANFFPRPIFLPLRRPFSRTARTLTGVPCCYPATLVSQQRPEFDQ